MPASQTLEYEGFRIRVRPAFWLRRWAHFWLYFQATQPSFEIKVLKVAEADPPPKTLNFHITFADSAYKRYPLDVSSWKIGDRDTLTTEKTLLSPTGDASVRLDLGRLIGFQTLYAFYVNPEATLVFLILNAVLGVSFGTIAALFLR